MHQHEQTPDALRPRARDWHTESAYDAHETEFYPVSSSAARSRHSSAWGAQPWADRARAELNATGETLKRRDPTTIDELTPQELQIALLLAVGKTTREAAAALFLSPKTIEYHLRHVYQKLDIHSRAELAHILAAQTPDTSKHAAAALT